MNIAPVALPSVIAPFASSFAWLLRSGAVLIALIIFLIDWISTLDVAIAVLYVVVILLSGDLFSRRGVLAVSVICALLTLAAYFLSHGNQWMIPAFARCLVSLAAIGITAFLALMHKSTKDALREQVRLLHRSEAFLAEAQRLSQTGSFGLRMPGAQMYWSEEARRIFGFDDTPAPTFACMRARTHPEDADELESLVELAHQQAGRLEGEFRLSMPDGSTKHIRLVACQAPDASGRCEYIGALMDVTAAKSADEALHRSQAQLAHITRVTTLGELASSIAHEVNQPLAAVTTNAEASLRWLNREVPDLGEVRSAIERMASEAHRASEVIRKIRALSRKTDPLYVSVDLPEVLEESIALVRREIRRHRVKLQLTVADSPLQAKGDRVQLQQVAINLLINAMQAMSGMSARARTLDVRLSALDTGDVLVRLADSGPGVAAQNLPNLFNPFFTTKPEGMGMGLSICRSIIEAHGGRIWAESELGHGAVLSFSLPASAPVQP